MTRLEAIAILDGFKYNPLLNEQHYEALDMAISALEKNESAEEWYKLICEKWDSAEGEYIKKEDALDKIVEQLPQRAFIRCEKAIESLPTYSFSKREKGFDSVIEDIKAELTKDYVDDNPDNFRYTTASLKDVLAIIDKHIADMRGKADV